MCDWRVYGEDLEMDAESSASDASPVSYWLSAEIREKGYVKSILLMINWQNCHLLFKSTLLFNSCKPVLWTTYRNLHLPCLNSNFVPLKFIRDPKSR